MSARPYIIARDRKILKMLKKISPKEIVKVLGLSSVSVVYNAKHRMRRG